MKTITLVGKFDEPEYSLLEGHVDIETFNKAFAEEGWVADPWPDDYVSHEYWVNLGGGQWECSNKNDARAIAVTVATWEGPIENPAVGPNPELH